MSGTLFLSMLATAGRRNRTFVVSRALGGGGHWVLLLLSSFLKGILFVLKPLLFCPASLPAVLPVTNQELETEPVYLHARLETDTQIAVVHLVLVHVGMEEVQVTGDSKEKIVVIRW